MAAAGLTSSFHYYSQSLWTILKAKTDAHTAQKAGVVRVGENWTGC